VIRKKRLLGAVLVLTVLAAGIICVYAIWDSHRTSAVTQSETGQGDITPHRFNREDNASQPALRPNPDWTYRPMGRPNGGWGRRDGGAAGGVIQYDLYLVIYSIAFWLLIIIAYYFSVKQKTKIFQGNVGLLLLALLGVGLVLRLTCAVLISGHPYDINTFKSWASAAANGLFSVYSNTRLDYPPLYIYILYVIGKISAVPALNPFFTALLKLPSIAADLVTSLLIYRLARKRLSLETGIFLCAFYLYNPAVLINSAVWGQVDSLFTMIVLFAAYTLAEGKIGMSAALFSAAVLMKPQGIIFLPVLFFALVRQRSWKSFLQAAVIGLGTAIAIVLPFSWNQGVLWIFRLFANTLGEYPYASVNAFNLFGILGLNYVRDTSTFFYLSYHSWGMIFIVLVTAFAWFIYVKGTDKGFVFAAGLLLIDGVFTFATGMHERYLFPALALSLLAFVYLRDKRLLLLSAGYGAAIYINTHFVLSETVKGINHLDPTPVLMGTSLLNIALYFYLVKVLLSILGYGSKRLACLN